MRSPAYLAAFSVFLLFFTQAVHGQPCNITDPGLTFSCNGNDIVLFSLDPVATGNGTSYTVSSTQGFLSSSSGQYGQVTSFLLQFSGTPPVTVEITITDNDDPNCSLTFTFSNPCINTPCDIFGASPLNVECNDNGTPNDPSDDFITFVLDPSGTGLGSGYEVTTSIGPVTPPTGTYGVETTFQTQPGTAGNGNFQITITDLDDNTCTFSIGVIDPGVCSTPAVCDISAQVDGTPLCNDNGTPTDPSDDTFTFTVSVTGNNTGSGWTANDPNNSAGGYGVATALGPYPISGGPLNITFTDNDDPNCTTTITVDPPAPCPSTPACVIQSSFVLSVACNDNGTPSDPSDDFYEIVLDPTGSGLGSSYNATSSLGPLTPSSAPYGSFTTFETPPGTATTNNFTVTVTDSDDPNCSNTITIASPPGPCSNQPPCNLTDAGLTNVVCNTAGTPGDPSDDFITFSLSPAGTNLGSQYNVSLTGGDINPDQGTYGFPNSFTILPGSFGTGDFTLTITDQDDPNCSLTTTIPNPCANQPPCDIEQLNFTALDCNDNGTPSDPSDDFITFSVLPTGQNLGSGYSITAAGSTITPGQGSYNAPTLFTLDPGTAGNGDISITITDNDDPACSFTGIVPDPGSCSNTPCTIDLNVLGPPVCDDNDTPGFPDDDTFTLDVFIGGSGTGSGWTADDPLFLSGTYGQVQTFGPYFIANGSLTITLTDADDPTCTATFTVDPPSTCSNACDLQAANLGGVSCNDSGTPADPDDDSIEFVLNPNGQNTGTTYTVTSSAGSVLPGTGTYGTPTAFQTSPGTAGNGPITLTITDVNDPACSITVTLPDPGTCSNTPPCTITDPGVVSVSCDDNGTPNDPSDDFLFLELFPVGITLSPDGYTLTSADVTVAPGTGDYGVTTTFQLIGAATAGSPITLTIADIDHPTCLLEFTIDNPAPCSVPVCDLQPSVAIAPVCDPAGTPTISDDDQFTVDIFVGGTGNGWQADDPSNTTGAYGTSVPFGPFPISGGPVTLTFTDVDDPNCQQTLVVDPPPTCSDLCDLQPLAAAPACDPAGTPSDPSDDIFFVDIQVNGTGTGWLADDPLATSGVFGQNATFGPYPINGGPVNLTFSLLENPNCQESVILTPPPTCSGACSIQAGISDISCDDNGTPGTSADDNFSALITVTGVNTGPGWDAGPPANTSGLYTTPTPIGPFPVNQGDAVFFVSDQLDPNCEVLVEIPSTGGCSAGCPAPDSTFLAGTSCNPLDTGLTVETLSNSIGCDSLVFTTTTLLPSDTTQLLDGSCNPQDTGTVETLLTNQFGCDSLIIETTTLLPTDTTFLQQSSCNPQDTGTVEALLQNQFGCDSLVITTTAFQLSDTTQLFSESCNPQDTGITQVLLQNQFGCDSLVVTTTTLLPSDTTQLLAESCNPADTGTTTQLLTNAAGCDSVIITQVGLLPSDTTLLTGQSCNPADTGTTTQLLTNAAGCDSVIITEVALVPEFRTEVILPLCPGDSVLFNGTYYSESNPQGQDTLTATSGCDSILLIAIELAAPLAEETISDTLCPGEQLSLLGEVFDEDRPGGEILLRSQGGCDSLRIRVDLRFEAPQAGLATEPAPCPGEPGRWQLTAVSGGRPPYRFAVDGGPLVPLGNLPAGGPLQPGTYTLRLEDARGCATAEAFNIAAGQTPILELAAEQIDLPLGDSVRLEPLVLSFSPDSIRWFTTAPISCTDCLSPVLRPLETSRVRVEAYAGNSCLARDEILLVVDSRVPVYIPNAFSPNADGRNDFFFPQARPGAVLSVRSLRIYTRWGEPVFENRDFLPNAAEAGWDGTFRGKPLNNGVYVYLLELEYPDGRTEVRSGDVTLVR